MSDLINPPAQKIDAIINFVVFDVAVKAAKTALVAEAPWIGWPVISQISDYLINWFATAFYRQISLFATFVIIDQQASAQSHAYCIAEGKVRKLLLTGDQNAINEAVEEYKATLYNLVRYNGSLTPH